MCLEIREFIRDADSNTIEFLYMERKLYSLVRNDL